MPLQMLETMLMRTFFILYASDFEGDDDRQPYQSGKSTSAKRRAFTLLSSVSCQWNQTLIGWRQSPTGHWIRNQIKKRKYTTFSEPTYTTATVNNDCSE